MGQKSQAVKQGHHKKVYGPKMDNPRFSSSKEKSRRGPLGYYTREVEALRAMLTEENMASDKKEYQKPYTGIVWSLNGATRASLIKMPATIALLRHQLTIVE